MNTSSRCPNLLASGSAYAKSFLNQVPSRSFSSTPPQNARRATRARRSLFRWLGTQGENFRNPLQNSTNYLSAYNNDGKLKRVLEATADAKKDGGPNSESQNEPDADGNKKLPPTTSRDMLPFPGNRKFMSQPVLSEELRELIWSRIMQDARSVREVSAELGVEMSRVGAVVRLKEIEKEWERVVCLQSFILRPNILYDDL